MNIKKQNTPPTHATINRTYQIHATNKEQSKGIKRTKLKVDDTNKIKQQHAQSLSLLFA